MTTDFLSDCLLHLRDFGRIVDVTVHSEAVKDVDQAEIDVHTHVG